MSPALVKESLQRDQFRLYQLIWKRFVASQMAPAQYETTSVRIGAGEYIFTVSASKIVFDGFMSVYKTDDDNEETNTLAKGLDENSVLTLDDVNGTQHFTQPCTFYRGITCKSTRRTGNRTSKYLCSCQYQQ